MYDSAEEIGYQIGILVEVRFIDIDFNANKDVAPQVQGVFRHDGGT